MKSKKKRTIIISSIIAAVFIVPLTVYAIVYYSSRTNSFAPGSVDIEVHEGDGDGDEGADVTKTYTWSPAETEGNFSADKLVQIKDTRTDPNETLRVCFVPMWYDRDEKICVSTFNFGIPEWNEENGTLTYRDIDRTITLTSADGLMSDGWRYQPTDGVFYYKGSINSSGMTAQLLESVELNGKAYELTEDCDLRLDVLADAIQSSGNADSRRHWNRP